MLHKTRTQLLTSKWYNVSPHACSCTYNITTASNKKWCPTLCISSMTYLPLGFKSAMKGVLSLIVWKSSMLKGTSTECAMASRCSTAFVLPPKAMTTVIAFSKACLVMMSRGLMSCFSSSSRALHDTIWSWFGVNSKSVWSYMPKSCDSPLAEVRPNLLDYRNVWWAVSAALAEPCITQFEVTTYSMVLVRVPW